MKLLIALLTAMLLTTPASAKLNYNKEISEQCRYLAYGNGKNNTNIVFYMEGIITAIKFTSVLTDFSKTSSHATIMRKACEQALIGMIWDSSSEERYMYQVAKLIDKRLQ